MATIKLPVHELQKYVQRYIIVYCSDGRDVDPEMLKKYLCREADIDASEKCVVEALLELAKNWEPKTSICRALQVSFKNGGVFFIPMGE